MEPCTKRRPGRIISLSELHSLSYAIHHFPTLTPNRWKLISEYVKKKAIPGDEILYDLNGSGRRFDRSHIDCHCIAHLLGADLLCAQPSEMEKVFFNGSDMNAFMPIILLPPVNQCCGSKLFIRNRPSHPRVYTMSGTIVAASFAGECRNSSCGKHYHYSYVDIPSTDGTTSRYYYSPRTHAQPYFQMTAQTAFAIDLLQDVTLNLEISWTSFESRVKVYNEKFAIVDEEKLAHLSHYLRKTRDCKDPWILHDQRLEEGWFIWRIVNYFDAKDLLASTDLATQHSPVSHRVDIETLCRKVWEDIVESPNEWVHHSCSVKGCKEGYITVDGIEKVTRTICSAPKEKIKLPRGFPNIIQCCHNSPIGGGKSRTASKFCSDHQHLEGNQQSVDTITAPPVGYSRLVDEPTGTLPDNDDDAVLTACKKRVTRYFTRTAGVLAAVRPCGVIVGFREMFTCESPSQVYIFLWLIFGKCLEDLHRLRYCGYDRACDLHPFLKRMEREGGTGAKIMLEHVKFLVDKFHCLKHTEPCCMPLGNPECTYHPNLPQFSEIHGTNTECAEQAFNWLGRYKHVLKRMSQYKYNFYLWSVIQSHNHRISRR